jgi:hypothetical protein
MWTSNYFYFYYYYYLKHLIKKRYPIPLSLLTHTNWGWNRV